MSNKHIELVKKWLADPESVSREELEINKDEALNAYCVTLVTRDANAANADAAYAATAAAASTAHADEAVTYTAVADYANSARAAATDAKAAAARWVKKYEVLSK